MPVRIGGATGFWGDSWTGARQLVTKGKVDYLVFDYLAELTMSILASARQKDPELGYATDFVSVTLKELLPEIVARNIKVVSNAGGLNPQACARAVAALAAELGLNVRIGVVLGDDVMAQVPQLRESGVVEFQSGKPLPPRLGTANAYLGALPIRDALDRDAQIVITGRCVDSAVTLGALMHAFRWKVDAFNLLAQGSLAGHILECGCQATGGLFTDWEEVPDWETIGFPIAECSADGSFVVTKPDGTGGLVTPAVLKEQMFYEVGDPRAYLLPDVVCDFSDAVLSQEGAHRVRVSGARGGPPTATYKVSSTYADGYRTTVRLTVTGIDAVRKAERMASSIMARARALLADNGMSDFDAVHSAVIGAEAAYGPHARTRTSREVVLHIAAAHRDKRALALLTREATAAGTATASGVTSGGTGRSGVSPWIKQFSFLIDKRLVSPQLEIGDERWPVMATALLPLAEHRPEYAEVPTARADSEARAAATASASPMNESIEVPLIELAHARSGDKGDWSNIVVIARTPEYFALLHRELTVGRVAGYLAHLVHGEVRRYEMPKLLAFNFVCTEALGGGGMASLRHDPLGKGMAQILLSMPLPVPHSI